MFNLPPPPFLLLDEYGNPISHETFKWLDFGAISYTEIIQNVKTILTTQRGKVALDRTVFMKADWVDLPTNVAQNEIVIDLLALQYHEPRVEILDISFSGDPLSGHLIPTLKLKIKNVVAGTRVPYTESHAFAPEPWKQIL